MPTPQTNDDQIAAWNGPVGERWARIQPLLDPSLAPFAEAVLAVAKPTRGARVLDVGCGCGATALMLAERVGAEGKVVGVDISGPMLARAKERAAGLAQAAFVNADASTVPLAELSGAPFDLVFSRFGVMFFADPVAAFAHLRGMLRDGGRVAFVCWRPLRENPWARVPLEAAASVVGRPEPTPPDAPGPFSLGDAGRLRGVLEGAGFRDVAIAPFDSKFRIGTSERPTAEEAAEFAVKTGPVARLLTDRDEGTIARVRDAVRAAVAPFEGADGVRLDAACWVASAVR